MASRPETNSIATQTLPAPRHWLVLVLILSAAVIAVGFAVQHLPGFTAAELGIDQDLSRNHVPVLTWVALALNILFGPVSGALIVLAVALYLFLVRRSPQRAALFVLTVASGWLAAQLFKTVVGRIRPDPALLPDALVPEPVSNSFPSGHTSLALALASAVYFLVLGTRWTKPVLTAGVLAGCLVAWSRVYVGAHYPMDIVASFPATLAGVLLLAGLWNKYAPAVTARISKSSGSGEVPHDRKF